MEVRARKRYIIRLPIDFHEFLQRRAEMLGVRLGTFVSALTEDELFRARRENDYRFIDAFEMFLPTRKWNAKSAGNQITVYLTDEASETLAWVEEVTGYDSYRTAITGLLLNTAEGKRFVEEQGFAGQHRK